MLTGDSKYIACGSNMWIGMAQKVGIDMVEIARFRPFAGAPGHPFLQKSFSAGELAYCFAYEDPAPHLAAIWAAKEAVAKALGASSVAFIALEIRHAPSGMPEVWQGEQRMPLVVSITHTDALAAAIAVG